MLFHYNLFKSITYQQYHNGIIKKKHVSFTIIKKIIKVKNQRIANNRMNNIIHRNKANNDKNFYYTLT